MSRFLLIVAACAFVGPAARAEDLASWHALPENFTGVKVEGDRATLESGKWQGAETMPDRWAYVTSDRELADVRLAATVSIEQPATSFRFFGESWSVWPDHTYGDRGFEAALLLRSGERERKPTAFGYRIELSHKYQCVALVKYPDGGYLRVVPCDVKLNDPLRIEASAQGTELIVSINGQDKIRYRDTIAPLVSGRPGVGTSSKAKVRFENVTVTSLPPEPPRAAVTVAHVPKLSVRKWLGDRQWIFDADEPILLLPTTKASYINNVKLRPGYKPQLSWNSHWDIQNQGAFPEGTNQIGEVTTSGGGDAIAARWSAKQTDGRFVVNSSLVVGYDPQRAVYTYDVDGELEVQPGEPFHFRYGYDFEHHTPLDPFNWQYLVVRREGGVLNHRPVYPIDPGPMYDVESYHGLRMWYGRHNEPLLVAPAVEYKIDPNWNREPGNAEKIKTRKLNTAVCAAFYDTGVSFVPETAPPGTKVRVKYRYTGYPADEAQGIFDASRIYNRHTLDPEHNYIFAEWPKLTFSEYVPLSRTWIYGRTPFTSGHNVRPTYELARDPSVASGFAIKLGPASDAMAKLPIKEPLTKGRYIVTAECKSENAHGPGGRLELSIFEPKKSEPLDKLTHYIGNGTFGWRKFGLAFDVPSDGCVLKLGLGNAGTGAAYFSTVEFRRLADGESLPAGVLAKPNSTPASYPPAPEGAIADYRMVEGAGQHVLDFAAGPFGLMELMNVDWTVDEGRPALRFADNTTGRKEYPRNGSLDLTYLTYPSYKDKQTVPAAIAGRHGGGTPWQAFTVSTFIKPAAEMGQAEHRGKGDIIGIGGRRFILGLYGQKAPYRLGARLNVSDTFLAEETGLEANRWYHVAMTGEPENGMWRVKLYVDGQMVHDGISKKFETVTSIPPSIILGAEIFYLHDAYYRGLIGRTMIFDRVLNVDQIAALAK